MNRSVLTKPGRPATQRAFLFDKLYFLSIIFPKPNLFIKHHKFMGIKPPKPEHRTSADWTPRVFRYDPKRALNVQRLKSLRTHPDRDNPDILANEIREICKERPLHTWSREEQQALCNLFGNNHPTLGITLTMAIKQIDIGLGQQVARLLTSNDLEGRRGKRAAMHGKNLECISRLRIATQQRRGLILN